MNKQNFALGKINFILLAVSAAVVIIGFILMAGSGSTEEAFNPDIYSVRRTKVAPMVCLVGFLSMVFAILYRPKKETPADDTETPAKK